ncbi:substrate-binding domain-containing protein [Oceanospirillum sediminis]|uniref:Substrate-binding domain-containing protein n=1 Tax=Oceanospirillum sediminis TaxID=2760088 RepID=A0A839ITZ5_9GAMM|nr:substrate-binding domain-containing protein [Oceanospirillum sediminis]MBB1487586.1 substrate-binding domain-containing protein [Oceanospirillum sediminis]
MKCILAFMAGLMSFFLMFQSAQAQFKIAVIGKTKNDSFYEKAFEGCKTFASSVDDLLCIYDGPADFQDPRSQALIVEKLLQQDVDGLLISTTNSDFLVERVLKTVNQRNIPVITFDSDLLPQHHKYRQAYVGTNNFDFGVALGQYANRLKQGELTEICIQSGSSDTPNLNERIKGVRFALSGKGNNQKLSGENGWIEHHRCPFYTLGKRSNALSQLKFIMAQDQPPIFLAVAGFAQFSPYYIEQIMPFREKIKSGDSIVISADAEQVQLEALEQNLSTVNIGQRPREMGRFSAKLIYELLKYQTMPDKEINYLGFYFCTEDMGVKCEIIE